MIEREPVCPWWRKSTYSGTSGGQCVEVAEEPDAVWIRDSTAPNGAVLRFPAGSWTAFVTAIARARL